MKLFVKLMNIIYLVFAAVAITCFCTKPFIQVTGGISADGTTISQVLPDEKLKEVFSNILPDDLKDQVSPQDLKDAFFKDADGNPAPLTIPLDGIKLNANLVIKFWDKENIEKEFRGIIEGTVNDLVDHLETPIHNLAVLIAKKTANKTIYDNILKQVQDASSVGSEEAKQKMEEAGIDEAYISNFTDEVYEKLSEEGATIDNVMEVVETKMFDVAEKLDITGFDPETVTGEVKTGLEEALKTANLMNEDGTIKDIDSAITTLLLGFLDGDMSAFGGDNSSGEEEQTPAIIEEEEKEENPGEEPGEKSYIMRLMELREDSSEEEDAEAKAAELKQKITDKIMGIVNDNHIVEMYTQYAFVGTIAVGLLALPWMILALVSFIRILRPKKCWVKTWYVFLFAFIQLILGIGLTVVTGSFLPKIAGAIGNEMVTNIVGMVNITVKTSSYIPSILYLVMIPVTIVYMIFAHKVKKAYKAEKKAKKEAKRAAKAAA